MKKVFSVMLVVVMTIASVLSFNLAHSQSEPWEQIPLNNNCVCKDSQGKSHHYSTVTACSDGGDSPCSEVACPDPPAGCVLG